MGKIVPFGHGDTLDFIDPNKRNLVAEASRLIAQNFSPRDGGDISILVVDCGVKDSMLRHLVERGARVKVVPWNHDISKVRDNF